jgi:hypothetical protein
MDLAEKVTRWLFSGPMKIPASCENWGKNLRKTSLLGMVSQLAET